MSSAGAWNIGAADRSAEGVRHLPNQVLIGKEVLKSLPRGVSLDVDIPAKVSHGKLVKHCRFRSVLAERRSVRAHGIAPLRPFLPLFLPSRPILPPDIRILLIELQQPVQLADECLHKQGTTTDALLDELPG